MQLSRVSISEEYAKKLQVNIVLVWYYIVLVLHRHSIFLLF